MVLQLLKLQIISWDVIVWVNTWQEAFDKTATVVVGSTYPENISYPRP